MQQTTSERPFGFRFGTGFGTLDVGSTYSMRLTALGPAISEVYGTIVAASVAAGITRDTLERYIQERPPRPPKRIVAAIESAFPGRTFDDLMQPLELTVLLRKVKPPHG